MVSGSTSRLRDRRDLFRSEEIRQRPGLRIGAELEGGCDIEEHALGEEVVDVIVAGAALALDQLVERRELLAHDLTDVLVTTGGIGLELHSEQVAIREEACSVMIFRLSTTPGTTSCSNPE